MANFQNWRALFNRQRGRAAPMTIIATAIIGSASASAAPLSCQKLEQNCESYVKHMLDAQAHTHPAQAGKPDPDATSVEKCQQQYETAMRTGLWPARGATPALPCTKQ
jgi:hypothetical protein